MKLNLKQEALLLLILFIPFIYLYMVWQQMAEFVPIHFNIKGEADNFTSKNYFLYGLIAFSLFNYFLVLILPFIDPKDKIKQMGKNFFKIRLLMVALMASVSSFIIYMASTENANVKYSMLILGVFLILMGNYFQTIQPNYFLGYKLPWTLHSETNWRKTHRFASWLTIGAGILIVLLFFLVPNAANLMLLSFIVLTSLLLPVLYSYNLYRKEKMPE